jgi:hypothetical protein
MDSERFILKDKPFFIAAENDTICKKMQETGNKKSNDVKGLFLCWRRASGLGQRPACGGYGKLVIHWRIGHEY